jgi:hypothetical protein
LSESHVAIMLGLGISWNLYYSYSLYLFG